MDAHLPGLESMVKLAKLSGDRRYRYSLTRRWSSEPPIVFIGLNPSTADETDDDPTIRRCVAFAKRLGGGALVMVNLFAFRATDPREMKAASDPVGPDNDHYLRDEASGAIHVIAAWGVHGAHLNREAVVVAMFPTLKCLGLTRDNRPRHPLYLPADAPLRPFPV